MLPRLQAEESRREMVRTAMGSGVMAEDDFRRIAREWDLQADGEAARNAERRVPTREALQQLGQRLGFGYRLVPRKPRPEAQQTT